MHQVHTACTFFLKICLIKSNGSSKEEKKIWGQQRKGGGGGGGGDFVTSSFEGERALNPQPSHGRSEFKTPESINPSFLQWPINGRKSPVEQAAWLIHS